MLNYYSIKIYNNIYIDCKNEKKEESIFEKSFKK